VLSLVASAAFADPLVGAGVGNADTFVSEGSKLFNKKQYAKAAEQFLKATRANPALPQTYVQLARAQLLAKELQRACYAYRVYLKSVPDSPDRKKAAAESDQCERQVKGLKKPPDDPTKGFVDQRAAFFTALDAKLLLGPGSAFDTLKALVRDGFLGPELGEMAQKLGGAATAEAESVHKRALSGEKLPTDALRSARPLYQVAQDAGASAADAKGKMAFLDGLAELSEKAWKKAEAHFTEAAKLDPENKEYVFFKGLALVQAGERTAALKVLEADLKDDPRTAVLRAALALGDSPVSGAAELEKLLFTTRYPPEK
jgi:tetratricopeptide (TPR) repeat protein